MKLTECPPRSITRNSDIAGDLLNHRKWWDDTFNQHSGSMILYTLNQRGNAIDLMWQPGTIKFQNANYHRLKFRKKYELFCNILIMNIKPSPNHQQYLLTLKKMGAEKRLLKALELSAITKELFLTGLRKRFPEKTETEIKEIYLQRLSKCHNRNY